MEASRRRFHGSSGTTCDNAATPQSPFSCTYISSIHIRPISHKARTGSSPMSISGCLRPWQYQPEYFIEKGLLDNPREVAHMRGLYDGEVRRADRDFARLLELLQYVGLYEDSLIAFTADHGEAFGEHGSFGHGRTLYEELLHVPLVMRFPGALGGNSRVDTRVSLVDVVPTILDLLGEDLPEPLPGASLVSPMRIAGERLIAAETRPRALPSDASRATTHAPETIDLRAVVRGDLKCIESVHEIEAHGLPVPAAPLFRPRTRPGREPHHGNQHRRICTLPTLVGHRVLGRKWPRRRRCPQCGRTSNSRGPRLSRIVEVWGCAQCAGKVSFAPGDALGLRGRCVRHSGPPAVCIGSTPCREPAPRPISAPPP